jgi:peptidoglycan/xylan/chitin deacetylase (PgdA/CDA1 family)
MDDKIKKYLNLPKNDFVIFLFHGVIEKNLFEVRNYNKKHILKKEFLKILKLLKRKGNVLSLDEILYHIKNHINLPKNTYAITFDDGFENNYSLAAPILDELNLPSTFYFSTDFIENNTMSWIDKIEYCVELKKKGEVYIPWFRRKIQFNSKQSKISLLENIRYFVKNNLGFNINNFVNHFFNQCNIKIINHSNINIDKKINWKQTNVLKNNKLFKVGGHSHEHLSLGLLSSKQSTLQIRKSFRLFKKRINLNLDHYSYPEGRKIDYNKSIITTLKSSGIKLCPTAIEGKNNLNTSLFDLKRILI